MKLLTIARLYLLTSAILCISSTLSDAQTRLKLGNEPTMMDTNAVLDLGTGNRGLLLPRVSLSSLSSAAPMGNHIEGMVVYNTGFAEDVSPGFYYNNGSAWIRLASGGVSMNVYSSDGTLASPRTINLGSNDLTLSGTGRFRISGSSGISSFSMGATGLFGIDAPGTQNGRLAVLENGFMGLGTATPQYRLDVVGDIRTNSVILNSDSLLKKDITRLTNQVQNLYLLSGYQYYWKNTTTSTKLQYGFLAQEVERYFPHLVTFDGQNKSVNYLQVLPLLLEALKSQEKRISTLEVELQKMQEAIQSLKK